MNKFSNFSNFFPYYLSSKLDFFFQQVGNFENIITKNEKRVIDRPIFICGLARSGTTTLLDVLNKNNDTASFIYKDLPFFKSLISWNLISDFYYKGVEPFPRYHGDGLKVSPNSPDAFEELIWKEFIQDYNLNGIFQLLFENYENKKFENYYKTQIKKILAIRGNKKRYLSKGNYNILRIKYIKKIFPDAKFIVCFRDPLENAQSALKVHENFKSFSKKNKYFDKILSHLCHFEFGNMRKSFNFSGFNLERESFDDEIFYYVNQWYKIYNIVNKYYSEEKNIIFIDNQTMIDNPKSINIIIKKLGLPEQQINLNKYSKKKYDVNNKFMSKKLIDTFLRLKDLETKTLFSNA